MTSGVFDYVVAGGGTTGAVVARRLVELQLGTVCLIEAGPPDDSDPRVTQLSRWEELAGCELDFDYAIEPDSRGANRPRHHRARVLGGCSSHSGAGCFRTPQIDLATWEALGAAGWGSAGCQDALGRVFARVHMEHAAPENACGRAFVEAAVQAGFPYAELGRSEVDESVGWFLLHKRGDQRVSASTAYLHPLTQLPPELELRTNTTALQVIIDDDRHALGIRTTAGPIHARREVIVSCGAIESPRLLMLSGVGPAEHLVTMGIPVAVDLPGVGEHLLDHPETVVNWESTRPVPSQSSQFWECTLFARTAPDLEAPDLQGVFATVPYDEFTAPLGYRTAPRGQAFAFAPHVTRSNATGTVRLRSRDPENPPMIDPRHDLNDEQILVRGIRLARRLAEMPALKPWIRRELSPGSDIQDDGELASYVRATSVTSNHQAGTCRMGARNDRSAVVDPELRVRGTVGLRVADTSIFPSDVGVNPVVTAMMIGEKAADLIGQP